MIKQLVLTAVLISTSPLVQAQSANDIITKNIAAVGGAERIKTIKTVKTEQAMNMMGWI